MIINELEFKQVNSISPESYNVLNKEGEQVAFVQLRWGVLRCLSLKSKVRLIYEFVFQDKTDGQFTNEEQRSKYLGLIADKIKALERSI